MSINLVDAADKFREIWELDDAELDDWQDPFEDEPDMPRADMPRARFNPLAPDAAKPEMPPADMPRARFDPLATLTTLPEVTPPAPPKPAPPDNAENYAVALEPEWHSSAPPELKPEPILTDERSIYAPKPPCRAPKIKNAQAQQAKAQQAATQRAQARAQRLAAFDAAFGRVRRVVCCAIADALCFAPDALKYEWQRADIFYHAARDEAARAQNYDAASAALKYQNARLRSLKNAVKETSCKKVF
jgi:hypothetical protein